MTLLVAALALAFQPMAEHFVEEDRGGAPAEDGRPIERFSDRGQAQRFQILRHRDGLFGEGFLVGQTGGGFGLKCLGTEHVHAIGGARAGNDYKPCHVAGSGHARAIGGDEVVGLIRGLE